MMLPLNLKKDKDGLLYTDDIRLIGHNNYINIDNREFNAERYYNNAFYKLDSTEDYILKYSTTVFTRKEIRKIKEMLDILVSKQKDVPNVDFPIAYYVVRRKLGGLIVPYYKNGISYDNILNNKDIEELGKYYAHDEDNIHNIFMLLNDVLELVYEMFENGIYYSDINPGNIVLTDNKVKLIDFDTHYVKFDNKDHRLAVIMQCYVWLLDDIIRNYELGDRCFYCPTGFNDAKVFTKKIENKIRKR